MIVVRALGIVIVVCTAPQSLYDTRYLFTSNRTIIIVGLGKYLRALLIRELCT